MAWCSVLLVSRDCIHSRARESPPQAVAAQLAARQAARGPPADAGGGGGGGGGVWGLGVPASLADRLALPRAAMAGMAPVVAALVVRSLRGGAMAGRWDEGKEGTKGAGAMAGMAPVVARSWCACLGGGRVGEVQGRRGRRRREVETRRGRWAVRSW